MRIFVAVTHKNSLHMKTKVISRYLGLILLVVTMATPFVAHSQYMYNSSGSMIGKYENGRIYDRSGSYVGKVDGERFYNRSGSYMGYVSGSRFYNSSGNYMGYGSSNRYYDRSGSFIGSISGNYIYNRSGSMIGRVSNVPQSVAAAIYLYGIFSF